MPRHQILRERLRAFEAGGGPHGAEHRDALRDDRVGDARDERRLRADHDQVGGQLDGERGDGRWAGGVDRSRVGQGRDAGVPRCGDQVGDGRVGGEGERERVFPPTRAQQQYAHNHKSYGLACVGAAWALAMIAVRGTGADRDCKSAPRTAIIAGGGRSTFAFRNAFILLDR